MFSRLFSFLRDKLKSLFARKNNKEEPPLLDINNKEEIKVVSFKIRNVKMKNEN